jgi:hypothetical protein
MNKVKQLIFFALSCVFILWGCDDLRKPHGEAEMIAHKKAAYAYNLTFVKKKQAVSSMYKNLVGVMDSLNRGQLTATPKTHLFKLDREDSTSTETKSLLAHALTYSDSFLKKLMENNSEFAHLSFVDRQGRVFTFPDLDTTLMIGGKEKISKYFSATVLDTSLTRYSSWTTTVRVEPYKGRWVYSCIRALDLNNEIQGWIVADVNLETLNSLISESEKEDCLIMSKEGGITFLGNKAAAVCSIPKSVPVFSPGNVLNNVDPNKFYSVYNTRDAAVRTALGKIITENSTREVINNNRLNMMLVVSPVNETGSLFVRVIEL